MAQLKDTVVSGSLRVTNMIYSTDLSLSGSQVKNYVFAAPSSANGAPAFRALATTDIPTISITDKTSGTLTVARGGTGITTATNVNAVVIGNSSTANSAMQTVATASGAFYATGNNAKPAFGTLPIAQGGTGITQTDPHKVLIGPNPSSGSSAAAPTWRALDGKDILNAVYPIGSIYMSVNNTSPATLFGGTWVQLKDQFLLGAGDTYTAGSSGGEATHVLTSEEMPSHTHTFTGTAVNTLDNNVGHTHSFQTGVNSVAHTHGFDTGTQSAGHTHTGPSHSHVVSREKVAASGSAYYQVHAYDTNYGSVYTGPGGTGNTGGISGNHTHSGTTKNNTTTHTHNGETQGVSTNHHHSVTAAGTNANTGGDTAHNNMPPYLAVYMWKRTE